jgi:deoxyribose-phosphate aldolase
MRFPQPPPEPPEPGSCAFLHGILESHRCWLRHLQLHWAVWDPVALPPVQIEEKQRLAAVIDHTLLKPEAARTDIERVCREAMENTFASVCINPYWVPLASSMLHASPVRVCTVIGFPLGANRAEVKLAEAGVALAHGARELDMVLNVGALRSGDDSFVEEEIGELAELAHRSGAILKVILETCLLDRDQKIRACLLAVAAKADFVKTSTGFSFAGATVEDVRLMREAVGPTLGVKASGGIRTLASVREMLAAGATRIGASAGVQILQELAGSPAASSGKY